MRLLSIDQAADQLRTTPVTVHDLIEQGGLEPVRSGLDLMVTEESVLRRGVATRVDTDLPDLPELRADFSIEFLD